MTPIEKFKALPEKTQQEILDKHRYRYTEYHEWWDSVYEQFAEKMEELGIIIHSIINAQLIFIKNSYVAMFANINKIFH